MAKAKSKVRRNRAKPAAAKKAPPAGDLDVLRKSVEGARTALAVAEAEAHEMTEKARTLMADAKEAYRRAVAPYRLACRKAEVPCEYEGGRGANVSAKVTFLVVKTDRGVRVAVKDRPDTEEVIPFPVLEESVNKAAYRFVEAHIGPRAEVGNKGGSLGNRLRAVLR